MLEVSPNTDNIYTRIKGLFQQPHSHIFTVYIVGRHDTMNSNETELLAIENRLAEAEKHKDEGVLSDLVSPTFEGVDPHGKRIYRELFIQAYTSPDFTIQSLDIDNVSVRIFDKIGTILGKSSFKGAFRNQYLEGTAEFMDIWHYSEDKWQLVASQVSPIERLE
jgi:hypothetical protein